MGLVEEQPVLLARAIPLSISEKNLLLKYLILFFFFNLQPSLSTSEICENFRTHDTHDSYDTCRLLNSMNCRKQVITPSFCGIFSCFETR